MGILQAVTALRSCASSPAGQCSPTNSRGTEPIDTPTTPSDIDIPTTLSDIGDKEYVAAFLDAQAERLCNDHDSETSILNLKVAEALADESAQCAPTLGDTHPCG